MLRALDEFAIEGVTSLLGFHRALLSHPCFIKAETCHGLVESEEMPERARQLSHQTTTLVGRTDGASTQSATAAIELDGRRFEVTMLRPEPPHAELARRRRERTRHGGARGAAREAVVSPMQGTVLAVPVAEGEEVEPGQVLCIVEAMKMENEITAHQAGRVADLTVAPGQPVTTGQVICVVVQDRDGAGSA
jgi:acetyl-CoA/propionyl-CoA carboxylase, biotin carboxylase, biotin carboxyl carrier protein